MNICLFFVEKFIIDTHVNESPSPPFFPIKKSGVLKLQTFSVCFGMLFLFLSYMLKYFTALR